MKDYKKTYCIEGEEKYFTCPKTILPITSKIEKKATGVISQDLPLSIDNYKRSIVRKRTIVIFEKK